MLQIKTKIFSLLTNEMIAQKEGSNNMKRTVMKNSLLDI
ncbi:hypothetical protein bcere0002_58260 [Bacillus cereus ATCC 10876]|nr:hypothetical protein bcere0002_58260 [Bacillus cereus ATCC 10876]